MSGAGETVLHFLESLSYWESKKSIERADALADLDALIDERDRLREALEQIALYGEERNFVIYADAMARMARAALTNQSSPPEEER